MSLYMLRRAGIYVFLSVAAFLSVFPFLWMALGATNKSTDIVTGKLSVGSNLLVNFQNLLAQVDLWRIFGNSFLIAIISTILTLAVSSLAGYGFEIFRSRVRERIFQLLLLFLSIPFAALMVPLFVMISRAQLTNTFTAVILPTIASCDFRKSACAGGLPGASSACAWLGGSAKFHWRAYSGSTGSRATCVMPRADCTGVPGASVS